MLNVVSFLKNVLPFIIFGLSVVVIVVNINRKNTYLSEGMLFGIALGGIVGYGFKFRMELCISLGMIVGEAVGSLIVKKK